MAEGGDLLRGLERRLPRRLPEEAGPVTLGRGRIFLLPTRAGALFAAALLVMLVASTNYDLSLGYALVFLLAGVAIASVIHAFRNLLHLTIRPVRGEPAFCGHPAGFRLQIENPGDRRRPALRLAVDGDAQRFDLAPGEARELRLSRPTHRRGRQPLGRVVIETHYPLGLVRAWSVLRPALDCVVYPAPERDAPPLPSGDGRDRNGVTRSPGNDDFAGLRAHRASDSPRHIAWKTLARGGPALTKEFAADEGGEVALEWSALPADLECEARLSRLTAWVLASDAEGAAFSLSLPHGRSERASGAAHAEQCLRRLALFATDERP